MWRVIRRLYLGDRADAMSRPLLRKMRFSHIVNCAAEIPCYWPDDFQYLELGMADPDDAFSENISEIVQFIDGGRRQGRVLVHCYMGISRSVSTILAYLIYRGKTLEEGLQRIQEAVGEDDEFMDPDEVFLDQLREYEADLREARQ